MRKFVILVLVLANLTGCAFTSKEEVTATPTPSPTATAEPIVVSYATIGEKTGVIAQYFKDGDWESIQTAISSDSDLTLESILTAYEESGIASIDSIPIAVCSGMVSDMTGYALLYTDHGNYEMKMRFDSQLQLQSIRFAQRNDSVLTEETDAYTEEVISIGIAIPVTGILCLPKEVSNAPVAILMPENLTEAADASGDDSAYRKDLAHALAEQGIASVRWNMRSYEDPLLFDQTTDTRMETLWTQDFAYVAHHLENYAVDATEILYIGQGTAGALGYYAVNSHFEIDGGLVLLSTPYAQSGNELFARYLGLSEEEIQSVNETISALSTEEAADMDSLYGYSLDYWKEWINAGALKYTPKVTMPILILAGENDESVPLEENYEEWKSQKGSNVSMKSYEEMGHDLRDADGTFTTLAEVIKNWYDGEDIEKETTKKS